MFNTCDKQAFLNVCRPCVTGPSQCVQSPEQVTAFGRMSNPAVMAVNLGASPSPLPLSDGTLLHNVTFTEGALRTMVPGVYQVSYSLTFTPNDYYLTVTGDDVPAPEPETIDASRLTLPSLLSHYDEAVIAGILVNGVPVSSTLTFQRYICCERVVMQTTTLLALPEGSVVSAAVWAGCAACAERPVLMPNSEVSMVRVGEIV